MLDARKTRCRIHQRVEQRRSRFWTEMRAYRIHSHDEHTVAVETKWPSRDGTKRPYKKSSCHDEDQGHRNLCRNQPV